VAQGFIASHLLTVTIGGTSAAITAGGTTGTNGATTVTFAIPVVPHGAQTVVVSDGSNSGTSATPFTVTSSATGMTPTSVLGGLGANVTILAQGFIASHTLTVTLNGTAATIVSGGTTGTNGASSVVFKAPLGLGTYTVVVSDGSNPATSPTQLLIIL
jgi:hypothetical protein